MDGFVFDRAAPGKVYAHDASAWWRSDDAGRRFTKVEVKGPGMKEMMKGSLAGPQFQSLAQDGGDAKTFYAGSWSNRDPGTAVFRTTDAGKKWQPAGTGITSSGVKLLRSGGPGTVLAACGEDGLFRTTDGGKSWSRVAQGLKEDDVEAVVVSADGKVFAGTFDGVFRSTDGGTSWQAMNEGLTNTDVRALAIAGGSPARLYAGLAGGGVASTELP